MSQHKEEPSEKTKSAARLWSRIEQIDRRQKKVNAELDAERAEIAATLDKLLHPNQ